MIKLNHITISVSKLDQAMDHYNAIFDCRPVAIGPGLAYYDLDGLWIALNTEVVQRQETYGHVAFETQDWEGLVSRLEACGIHYTSGRSRAKAEGQSIYIRDKDLNLIEFHQGSLSSRLAYYQTRQDIKVSL